MKTTLIITTTLALCVVLPDPGQSSPFTAIIRPLVSGVGHTFVKTSAAAGAVAKVAKVGGTALRATGTALKSPIAKKMGLAAAGGGMAYGGWTAIEETANAIKNAADTGAVAVQAIEDELEDPWREAQEAAISKDKSRLSYNPSYDHPLRQPPVPGELPGVPTIDALDKADDLRPLSHRNPNYGQGVRVVANFQGQIEMHRLGQLVLGLEEGVITIDYPTETLLQVSAAAIRMADTLLEHVATKRLTPSVNPKKKPFDLYALPSTFSTLHRVMSKRAVLHDSAAALTFAIQGVDRPTRDRRWVQEVNLGLGAYRDINEAAKQRWNGLNDPPSGTVQVHLKPSYPDVLQLNRTLVQDYNSTWGLINMQDDLWSERFGMFGLSLEDLIRKIDVHTSVLRTGLAAGKLSSDFIPWEDLREGFRRIHQEAKVYQLVPLVERAAQLLAAPLRMRRRYSQLTMWLEVPLMPTGETPYDILKASPALLRTPNGHLLQVRTGSTLLRKGTEMLALPDAELENACHSFNGVTACARSLTYQRRASCETEMLGDRLDRGEGQCRNGLDILSPFEEHASQVGVETFDWYAPYPTEIEVSCADGRKETSTLQGLCRVELERGCGVNTGAFRLDRAEAGIKVPERVLWTVPPVRIAQVLGKVNIPDPETMENLGDLLRDMRNEHGGPTLGTFMQSLGTMNQEEEREYGLTPRQSSIWIVVLTGCLIVRMIIIPCITGIHRKCCNKLRDLSRMDGIDETRVERRDRTSSPTRRKTRKELKRASPATAPKFEEYPLVENLGKPSKGREG